MDSAHVQRHLMCCLGGQHTAFGGRQPGPGAAIDLRHGPQLQVQRPTACVQLHGPHVRAGSVRRSTARRQPRHRRLPTSRSLESGWTPTSPGTRHDASITDGLVAAARGLNNKRYWKSAPHACEAATSVRIVPWQRRAVFGSRGWSCGPLRCCGGCVSRRARSASRGRRGCWVWRKTLPVQLKYLQRGLSKRLYSAGSIHVCASQPALDRLALDRLRAWSASGGYSATLGVGAKGARSGFGLVPGLECPCWESVGHCLLLQLKGSR